MPGTLCLRPCAVNPQLPADLVLVVLEDARRRAVQILVLAGAEVPEEGEQAEQLGARVSWTEPR